MSNRERTEISAKGSEMSAGKVAGIKASPEVMAGAVSSSAFHLVHAQRAYEGLELLMSCTDTRKFKENVDNLDDIAALMRIVNAGFRDDLAELEKQAEALCQALRSQQA
jgi:hypothetical protein